MGWLDALGDWLSKNTRGYDSTEKYKESLNTPYGLDESGMPGPEAERFAAQKLAAERGAGDWSAAAFNALALSDLAKTPTMSMRTKRAGDLGREAGLKNRKQ